MVDKYYYNESQMCVASALFNKEYTETIKTISIIVLGIGQQPIPQLLNSNNPKKTVLVFVIDIWIGYNVNWSKSNNIFNSVLAYKYQ